MRDTAYLNGCGRLNLSTGKNLHFNILADWDERCHLTVSTDRDGRVKVIGGWGERYGTEGEVVELQTASHRYLGTAILGKAFPATAEGLAALRQELGGARSVAFATLD